MFVLETFKVMLCLFYFASGYKAYISFYYSLKKWIFFWPMTQAHCRYCCLGYLFLLSRALVPHTQSRSEAACSRWMWRYLAKAGLWLQLSTLCWLQLFPAFSCSGLVLLEAVEPWCHLSTQCRVRWWCIFQAFWLGHTSSLHWRWCPLQCCCRAEALQSLPKEKRTSIKLHLTSGNSV